MKKMQTKIIRFKENNEGKHENMSREAVEKKYGLHFLKV